MFFFGGGKFSFANNLRGFLNIIRGFLDDFRQSFKVHIEFGISHASIEQFNSLPSNEIDKESNSQAVNEIGEHGADNRDEDISFDGRGEF